MIAKIAMGLGVGLLIFIGYVSTRKGEFRYERSGMINAPAEKIFPYLSDFKLGGLWSPYEQMDPTMKKSYSGTMGQVGSQMEFEGNGNSGSGKLEILKLVPNESVDIRLTMLKPFYGENLVRYKLTPEGAGTRFTWTMSGNGGFLGKLMTVIIDCEKMVGGQFEAGIANLKGVLEAPQKETAMNLSEKSEIVQWPTTHYVFTEKIGPFQDTAMAAWGMAKKIEPDLAKSVKVLGGMSLYKIAPKMIYRAGFKVDAKPEKMPEGFQYMKFEGGKYSRYTLKGSYSNLPEASGKVFKMVEKEKIAVREDFNIENYANDPGTTPEDQLITEILIPTK